MGHYEYSGEDYEFYNDDPELGFKKKNLKMGIFWDKEIKKWIWKKIDGRYY